MHAQEEAVAFYEKIGWSPVGGTFYEANIPHRVMIDPPKELAAIERLLLWEDPDVAENIKEFLKRQARRR